MHFTANVSSLNPYHDVPAWNRGSQGFRNLLDYFDNHDLEIVEIPQDDPRYEQEIDLVGNKDDGKVSHRCKNGQCKRIYINVSGQMFETQLGTLNRFPNTLLGNPTKRRLYWDPCRRYYFLNQHAPTFQSVLYYYQSGGRLYRPDDVPEEIFISELEFYELGAEVLRDFKLRNGFIPEQEIEYPKHLWQKKLWLFLEYPNSSLASKIFGVFSLAVILLSIITFCLETSPSMEAKSCINESRYADGQVYWQETLNHHSPFYIMEVFCTVWFTIEVMLRFIVCPDKKRFFLSLMNLFDIGAVIPFYINNLIVVITGSCNYTRTSNVSIVLLRVLRLFRAFRIFKLTKHSRGMQILGIAIQRSLKELSLFAIFLAIAVILFSAAIYYADLHDSSSKNISSIPDGFWWTIITMCTVGYGDVVPSGPAGKLVGSLCLVSGVVTITLLVPVVVSNFSNFYNHELEKLYENTASKMKDRTTKTSSKQKTSS